MKKIVALCTAAVLCLSLLTACSGSREQSPSVAPGRDVDLAAFAQTVQENHEFHSLDRVDPSDPDLGAVMLENTYPGLKDMDLEQIEVYLAMISFSGGELALVQAKSPEDAAKVKEIFQARIDQKSVDDIGNYPEEVEMWKNHGKLADNGNYVMLVNHEDSEAIVSEFNGLFQ